MAVHQYIMLKFLQPSESVQVSHQYRLSVRRQVREVALSQKQRDALAYWDQPRVDTKPAMPRAFQGWKVP